MIEWLPKISAWIKTLAVSSLPHAPKAIQTLSDWMVARPKAAEELAAKLPADASDEDIVRMIAAASAAHPADRGGDVVIRGGDGGDASGANARAGHGGSVTVGDAAKITGGDRGNG
jgi:hypothetical protein